MTKASTSSGVRFSYSPSVTTVSLSIIVPVGATYAASAFGGASYAS
jgi:hypothetical protein